MNRWRHVRYADDGCYVFQCLKCKGTWETRTVPLCEQSPAGQTYCGWCGNKWEGEHKWGYDRMEFYAWMRPIQNPLWRIQSRVFWREKNGSLTLLHNDDEHAHGWKDETLVICCATQALLALNHSKTMHGKDDGFTKREYRVQIVKRSSPEWERLKDRASNHDYVAESDYRYFEEYVEDWNAKRHHPPRERRWYLTTERS